MRLDRGKLFMATAACLALFNPWDVVAANWSAAKCQFQCSAKKCGTNTEFAKQCIQNCDLGFIENCTTAYAETIPAYQKAKKKCDDSYTKCITPPTRKDGKRHNQRQKENKKVRREEICDEEKQECLEKALKPIVTPLMSH